MFSAMFFSFSGLPPQRSRLVSFSKLIRCCNRHLVTSRLPQSPCRPRGLINLRVLRGGRLPRKILFHAVQLNAFPDALIGKMMQRLANRVKQSTAGVVPELEAGSSAVLE